MTGQLLKGKLDVRVELPPELKAAAWMGPMAFGFLAGAVLVLVLRFVFGPQEPRR